MRRRHVGPVGGLAEGESGVNDHPVHVQIVVLAVVGRLQPRGGDEEVDSGVGCGELAGGAVVAVADVVVDVAQKEWGVVGRAGVFQTRAVETDLLPCPV